MTFARKASSEAPVLQTFPTNAEWVLTLVEELAVCGVRDYVVCPGRGNSPIVAVLSECENIRVSSFFDERSAAFFALGYSRRIGKPVAVVVTPGTAVMEIGAALQEAFYSGTPLVAITADHPHSARGLGLPQSIVQSGIFSDTTEREWDLALGQPLDGLNAWSRKKPIHINLCLKEPLAYNFNRKSIRLKEVESPFPVDSAEDFIKLGSEFLHTHDAPLIIVGGIKDHHQAVVRFLNTVKAPYYLESPSQLRGHVDSPFRLSSEQILSWGNSRKIFDGILRIGNVPAARMWLVDLQNQDVESIDILSLSELPFAGVLNGKILTGNFDQLSEVTFSKSFNYSKDLLEKESAGRALLDELCKKLPKCEVALIRKLGNLISPEAFVFLGNSQPIREWDLATYLRFKKISANRGVNGIDGQVSSFYGEADAVSENWALFGDLTTLCDLSGPWALSKREPGLRTNLVVINNSGGHIFSRVTQNPHFINAHALDFSNWAKMWKLNHELWEDVPLKWSPAGPHSIIELVPNALQTQEFCKQWDAFWLA